MAKNGPQVGIMMGSDSDLPVMEKAMKMLESFGVRYEFIVASAHRSPKLAKSYASSAQSRGLKAIIAAAGHAAHLAGAVAAETSLPVIGVPIPSSDLKGLDSLLSTVQMPGGIPVATMCIGSAGATNAGVFAAQIVALGDKAVARKLAKYKKDLETAVMGKNKALAKTHPAAAKF